MARRGLHLRAEHSAAHPHHLPAVDHDRGTGDETALVGGEQQQRAVEIARLAACRARR